MYTCVLNLFEIESSFLLFHMLIYVFHNLLFIFCFLFIFYVNFHIPLFSAI